FTAGKKRFNIEEFEIKEGEPVDLSLFIPGESFIFSEKDILSSSRNSIFLDNKLTGKTIGVITQSGFISK
ncbi:MAG: dihydroorotase, partial [Gramella sp.]|nr:dihydroorotase [Christiangramia sp.]